MRSISKFRERDTAKRHSRLDTKVDGGPLWLEFTPSLSYIGFSLSDIKRRHSG